MPRSLTVSRFDRHSAKDRTLHPYHRANCKLTSCMADCLHQEHLLAEKIEAVMQVNESFLMPVKMLDRMAPPILPPASAVNANGTKSPTSQVAPTLPNVDISNVICLSRSIGRNRSACEVAVAAAFNAIFDRSVELDCLKPIAAFAQRWNPQEYKDGGRTVEQFRNEMALIR